jgi:hypothetical protein
MKSPETFPESLGNRVVPWEEAKEFSINRNNSINFIYLSIHEILSDSIPEIRKRLNDATGTRSRARSCCSSHSHCHHDDGDYLDELIGEATNRETLAVTGVEIIRKANQTYRNVLARGGGVEPNRTTDSYIRRQILKETIIRETVNRITEIQTTRERGWSQEGHRIAHPKMIENFGQSANLNRLSGDVIHGLVHRGWAVLNNFLNFKSIPKIFSEFEYLERSLQFRSPPHTRGDTSVYWWSGEETNLEFFSKFVEEFINILPFELNLKNHKFFLHTNPTISIIRIAPGGSQRLHSDNPNGNGIRITALIPVAELTSNEATVRIGGEPIPLVCGQLILIDSTRIEYECPVTSGTRYHITGFIRGPK